MAVALVNLPLPWQAKPSLLDFGVDQTAMSPAGVQQREVRIGSRWAVAFNQLADLAWNDAQAFLAARFAAQVSGSTVTCAWPQPGLAGAGTPVVSGAGQGGATLNVRGLTAGLMVPGFSFFSAVGPTGRSYLYQTVGTAIADGGGNALLPIAPWIRAAPADGAAINLAAPVVEGFIAPGVGWTIAMSAWVSLPAFTITELE